jgi:hypothetical protein
MPNEYFNSGILYRNEKKEPGSRQPDFRGEIDVTCTHCNTSFKRSLAGWIKEGKKGKFFSLSCKPDQRDNAGRQHFRDRVAEIGEDIDAVLPER